MKKIKTLSIINAILTITMLIFISLDKSMNVKNVTTVLFSMLLIVTTYKSIMLINVFNVTIKK